MVISELSIPDPRFVAQFDDIPPDTLHALRIIEPAIYGGPLKTVGRAAHLLQSMDEARFNLSAKPAVGAMPSGVAVVHEGVQDFWVQSIAVDPRYRGSGVGSALMQTIERIGKIQNMRSIRLRVIGESALEFYERLGYYPDRNGSENSVVIDLHKPLVP